MIDLPGTEKVAAPSKVVAKSRGLESVTFS